MRAGRSRLRLGLTAALGMLAGCQSGPAAAAGGSEPVPPAASGVSADAPAGGASGVRAGGERVYVTNQDEATVTIVDAVTLEVVATVDLQRLGYGPNARPHHVVVEEDGSHWYVSLIGANRVLKLDRDHRVVGEAEFEVPGLLALDGSARRLYVGRSMSAVNPPERIGIVDRDGMTIEELSVFFPRPHALAAHPHLPLVYSASLAQNTMAVIRPAEEDVTVRGIAPPTGGTGVHMLMQWAISPDGGTLVGTGEMSGRLLVFDLSDPAEPELIAQVATGPRPWEPVFSPDGAEVWFANKANNSVTVVDVRSWTVAEVITGDGLAEPHGAAISADGRYVFISNNNLKGGYTGENGTLVVIDRATRQIVKVIPVGRNPTGVGIGVSADAQR